LKIFKIAHIIMPYGAVHEVRHARGGSEKV